MAAQPQLNLPEWTESSKKNGIDPLGMQNTSVVLYQALMPGISNVTLRVRYYGLYAWLLDWYARESGSTDPEEWRRYVRRAEALYALVAAHAGGQQGVAGIEWAQRALAESDGSVIDFEEGAAVYLKQKWGAFGAAYGSQLIEIGLFQPSDSYETPLLTDGAGVRVAQAFEGMLGEQARILRQAITIATVSRDALTRLAVLLPGAIEDGSEEQRAYRDLIFHADDSLPASGQPRRRTLRLVLAVAALLGRAPTANDVRWTLYAGQSPDGEPLVLADDALLAHRQHWWTYQANDLCHLCLETLLKFALDRLGHYPDGAPLDALIQACIDAWLAAVDGPPATWADLRERQALAANAFSADDPHAEWSRCRAILAGAGRSSDRTCSAETAWEALNLLATLERRLAEQEPDGYATLPDPSESLTRSLRSEAAYLAANDEAPFRDTLEGLLWGRVLRRHLWVAMKKLRYQKDYTFLLELDDGRVRLRDKDGPALTNPRLAPAITFLRDLHLLDAAGLTPDGAALLHAHEAF